MIATALTELADLILPRRCVACGRSATVWCAACRPVAEPTRVPQARPSVFASCAYEGPLRTAILAYKERGRRELIGALGALLVPAIQAALAAAAPDADSAGAGGLGAGWSGAVALVPVPSSARARRERGGDHLVRLARRAGRITGCPVIPALRLARTVQDSAGLGAAERRRNLYGAMRAIPPPATFAQPQPRSKSQPQPHSKSQPHSALLVDDIVTTGASLAEAARALSAAGWVVAGAAVIAATPRRRNEPRDEK